MQPCGTGQQKEWQLFGETMWGNDLAERSKNKHLLSLKNSEAEDKVI